jgi:hypothetical protein
MNLGDRLRAVEIPEEEAARERGWRVVRAAYGSRRGVRPSTARRLLGWRPAPLAASAVALVVLTLLALTPPGRAVADWVRERLAREQAPARLPARPALSSLPGGGRLLVLSPEGAWVVRADGSRRLLGPYEDATWSPHGLFVGATRHDELLAVTPGGQVRWSIGRRSVADPRWAPSGFRVAYRSGRELRVVAGDGTGDRSLVRPVAAVAPAWRPAPRHLLAVADRSGRVSLFDTDGRRRLWRSSAGEQPRQLAWSADGRRLLVVGPRILRVLDARGRELARRPLPAGATAGAAAFAPRGHGFALVRRRADGDEVVLLRADAGRRRERLVLRGLGRFGELAWSPDGRWLAVPWPTADQWVFVRPGTLPVRTRGIDGIARQFDPAVKTGAPSLAPRIAGWCCAG